MLEVDAVYEKERSECDKAIARAKWKSFVVKSGVQKMACPRCASGLLEPHEDSDSEVWLECRSCGSNFEPRAYIPWAVMTELAADEVEASRQGRERLYTACPNCGEIAYLLEEKQCALCGILKHHPAC